MAVRTRRARVVRGIVIALVSLLAGYIVLGIIETVDWQQVGSALGRLTLMTVPVLVVLLILRQAFNAVPLARFVAGLGWWRSAQNDVTANLMGTVTPPPGDVVVRVAMFRSWGVNPVDGMAGVTLNSLTFYVIRFAVPAVGLVVLIGEEVEAGRTGLAIASLILSVAIVVALVLVSRGERLAALIGRTAGSVAARFRESVDPGQWESSVLDFRGRMSSRLTKGLPTSLTALAVMVLIDGIILLTALRVVGVSSEVLPLVWILGAFLIAYPLTAMPLAGLGLLDAALIVVFTDIAGESFEPDIIAAFVIWRVVTLGGPLLLGGLSFLWWRWHDRTEQSVAEPHTVESPTRQDAD